MKGKLKYVVMAGRLEGKHDWGRPRETMLKGVTSWCVGISVSDVIACIQERRLQKI